MRDWRAWYTDEQTYNSARTEPADLPKDGLLGIVQYTGLETPKRHLLTGYDRYFWWDGPDGLVIGGNDDSEDDIRERYPGAVVVRGKWTTPEEMKRVQDEMQRAQEPLG